MQNLFTNAAKPDSIESAELFIRESIQSILTLFHSSPSCMSLTTEDRVFVDVNARFLEIYGFEKEEIIGRNSFEVGILDDKEHQRVSEIMKTQGRIKNEIIKCRSKNGAPVYAISCIEKIAISGRSYWISSFLDITPVKQQQLIIEGQNKEIMESIQYARLIQKALFPPESYLSRLIPDSFVLVKPKNILSGDFYWIKEKEGKIFIAACDCTGHGVPGAFISIIGYKLLNKFVVEYGILNPAEILNQLNTEFRNAEKINADSTPEIKDGMDIALCVIDKLNMTMEYAGAYNPVYQVRNGVLTQLATDKIPIHLFTHDTNRKFINHQIKIESGDSYYLFSDGYADQFGGPKGKKFRYKNFQEMILSSSKYPMADQKQIYNEILERWKNDSDEQEQTDDILIVGYKIP